MILGTGIDLVEIPRIARILERRGGSFLQKNFHEKEIEGVSGDPASYFAVLFALKEAVLKALGQGIFTLDLSEIEIRLSQGRAVVRLPSSSGKEQIIDAAYSADHAWAAAIAVRSLPSDQSTA